MRLKFLNNSVAALAVLMLSSLGSVLRGEAPIVNDQHKELHASYEASLEENFKNREEQEQNLATKYGGAVGSVRDKLAKLKVQFAVDLAEGELGRLKANDFTGYPEGVTVPDALLELREVFDEYYEKVDRGLSNQEAVTLYTYDMGLQQLSAELQAAGDAAGVEGINKYRYELLNPPEEPAAEVASNPPSSGGGTLRPGGTLSPNGGGSQTSSVKKPRKRMRPQMSREVMERTMKSMPKPMGPAEITRLASQMGPRPVAGADGSYPELVASMNAGAVSEITPDIISSWGPVRAEMAEGTPYWTINVRYTTRTIFGNIPTEGKAMVSGGKVKRWIYSGSLEPIP